MKDFINPDFLPILQENLQIQISGFYNVDKTLQEKEARNKIIEEYKDLIILYKNMKSKLNP